MAGGWSRDRAVQDQIEDMVKDAVLAARARLAVAALGRWGRDSGHWIKGRRGKKKVSPTPAPHGGGRTAS